MRRPIRRHNFCANFLNYEIGSTLGTTGFCIVPVGDRSTILPSRPGKLFEGATITFNAPLDASTNPHTKTTNEDGISWDQRLFHLIPLNTLATVMALGFPSAFT